MSGLRRRVEQLEAKPRIEPTPRPENEEARIALARFQDAVGALRSRTGGERRDHDPDDPVVGELAAEARRRFRAYIRASRGSLGAE